jgi:hypothetical protein
MRPRLHRDVGRAVSVGGAFALLLCSASAGAATVRVRPSAKPGFLGGAPAEIAYTATPGELNRAVIQAAYVGSPWTVTDLGAPVVPGDGCTAVDAHTARCTAPFDGVDLESGLWLADAALGDGDDEIRLMQPDASARFRLFADGGPGNDVLIVDTAGGELRGGPGDDRLVSASAPYTSTVLDGGGGRDELHGGYGDETLTDGDVDGALGEAAPGPDVLDGGLGGVNTLSYRQRTAPVFVGLQDRTPEGARGEGDRVRLVQNVIGGAGDDRLVGDAAPNQLDGGRGRDTLIGRDNDDRFLNADGPVSCGSGDDAIVDPVSADYAKRGCETVVGERAHPDTSSFVYPERVRPRAVRYRVRCPVEDEEFVRLRCVGRVTMREASGRHRRLADGRTPRGRWVDRGFDVALTPLGRRRASARSGVLAQVTFSVRTAYGPPDVLRWTIRLKVPR